MNDPDFRRRLRETFQTEASEHLRALSQETFALEKAATVPEHQAIVEKIFRETHTLKGAARMVGETEAEAICHTLEQELSGLKRSGNTVPPPLIEELHTHIRDLARQLGLAAEPAAATASSQPFKPETAPASETPAPSAAVGGQVRVPGARLDTLLLRAEEMASAKLTGDLQVAELRTLSERGHAVKKETDRLRPDLAALRRFIDRGEDSPIAKEVAALLHYVDWNQEFLRTWNRDLAKLAKTARADQRRLGTMIGSLLEETKEILMQPFSSLLETFPGFVREIARQQGKDIELHLEGTDTEIDRRVLEEIRDALIHLVRNSIDHGIEPAAERRALGKPERGRLTLAVRGKSGGIVEVTVSDDGRGIDPALVTASARRLNLISDDATDLSDHEALALLFRSGFSTKAVATDLSGRGIGLAIVREKAEQIGGTVSVESKPARGTTFHLQVPLTLARFRGLFVSAQHHTFVVPAPYVRRVVRVRENALKRVKNQQVYEDADQSLVVLALADVLGLKTAAPKRTAESPLVFLLLLESGHSRIALRVDEVPVEEEIVMKSLGRMLRGARQYVGATLVAGGQIVPVLNVSHLLDATVHRRPPQRGESSPSARAKPRRKRTVLVAEDSITSRSLLKSILQTAGFEVRTAVDGADAFTMLKFEPIDLVISDVQMPRLDGFELTAKIRADAALSTLPVILITSLASREDKARGVDAGANAYIVKSSFDQSDLLESIGRLLP